MTKWNDRLKTRMKERKTTQEDLAAILNISQSSVGHYVSGRRNPRKDVLKNSGRVRGVYGLAFG
jgi:transcriptional regulator with XRE-family HTH domain